MSEKQRSLPIHFFLTLADWEAWLAAEGETSRGLWLKLAKKTAGADRLTRQDAIDAALCHGWIDGQLDALDAAHWLVRFTPRRAGGKWSRKNRERADELTASGRMRPAGLREIESAKADGRWEAAYESQGKATIPDDLSQALNKNARAKRFFDQLDSANRYAILYRVADAKKPETRNQRIEKFVAMLARGETIHPSRRKIAKR